jgi:hypothetical protein
MNKTILNIIWITCGIGGYLFLKFVENKFEYMASEFKLILIGTISGTVIFVLFYNIFRKFLDKNNTLFFIPGLWFGLMFFCMGVAILYTVNNAEAEDKKEIIVKITKYRYWNTLGMKSQAIEFFFKDVPTSINIDYDKWIRIKNNSNIKLSVIEGKLGAVIEEIKIPDSE